MADNVTTGGDGGAVDFRSLLSPVDLKEIAATSGDVMPDGSDNDGDGGDAFDQIVAATETDGEDQSEPTRNAEPQAQAKPETKQSGPDPWQYVMVMQEQQAQLAAQIPNMVAQAVAQALAQVQASQQPQPQAEVDPLAALDQNDPDYYVKKFDLQMQRLEKQNAELRAKLEGREKSEQEQMTQAQRQAQHQQFVAQVNADLTKAVDFVTDGWPQTPQVQSLREAAANIIDKVWYDSGWRPEGYTAGIKQAQQWISQFAAFKNPPPAQGQQRAPVSGSRAASTTPGTEPIQNPKAFWDQLASTRSQDAAALRQSWRQGDHN